MSKQYMCPTYAEIRMKACPRPPTKVELINKVKNIAFKNGKQEIGIIEKRTPDKNWLTYNPSDEIFDKSYMPPPKKKHEPMK